MRLFCYVLNHNKVSQSSYQEELVHNLCKLNYIHIMLHCNTSKRDIDIRSIFIKLGILKEMSFLVILNLLPLTVFYRLEMDTLKPIEYALPGISQNNLLSTEG